MIFRAMFVVTEDCRYIMNCINHAVWEQGMHVYHQADSATVSITWAAMDELGLG
jgi:hypothetical protein